MGENDFIIKARGLPWSATGKEVASFFGDCEIVGDENGVHLTTDRQGRPSGECFIELASQEDFDKAKGHNKENMGKRYIEIQDSNRAEMEWFVNRMPGGGGGTAVGGVNDPNDGFVRLRGLPFESTKRDIAAFFDGIGICPYGITITMDQDGRPSGDAYVEFVSPGEAEKAIQKNREKIGHRYIEIFKSSKSDVKYVIPSNSQGGGGGFSQMMGGRPGPYDRPGFQGGMNKFGSNNFNQPGGFGGRTGGPMRGGPMGGPDKVQNGTTGHMIHMRGLPFEATQGDVYQFLVPIIPVEVRILTDPSGRAKGACEVDFNTHSDAEAAMGKNKQNMGHRYIEMFLKSSPDTSDDWSSDSTFQTQNRNSGMTSGFGGGYSSGYGSGMGGVGGMSGGNYTSDGFGGSNIGSGYSSFDQKPASLLSLPRSGSNYYSSMR